jgi:xanthine dehydrogenase accessory factor
VGGDARQREAAAVIATALAERAEALRRLRRPFATATVVRAARPTSARPGDVALVLADGTLEGFVGGVCAREEVSLHGVRVLETGEPLLLRLTPDPGEDEAGEGTVTAHNPCLSGGSLEVFLDPVLPAPRVVVTGDGPVADALRDLAPRLGFEIAGADAGGDALAVVVAAHGRDEGPVLAAALEAGVPYVGLVASRRRGTAVRAALAVPDALRGRLRTPAGLDLGARTPPEIALSILAEIVAERRSGSLSAPAAITVPAGAAAPADGHPCHG